MSQNEQVSITLSFKKDDAALISVNKEVQGFLDTLSKGLDLGIGVKLADSLLALPGQLRGAIEAGVEYATTVRNMALETRMTESSFQAISLVATQYGAQMNVLTTAIQHMSTVTGQAVNGNQKMVEVFARLGINAREFSTLAMPQQLEALAAAGDRAGWSAQALNDIAELLGRRAAPQLLGMLHAIADDGLKNLTDEAVKAGAVLSDTLTEQVAQLGNEFKQTGQIWKVTGSEFVAYLKPTLDILDKMLNAIARITQWGLLQTELLASRIKATFQSIIPAMLFMNGKTPAREMLDAWAKSDRNVHAEWDAKVTMPASTGLVPTGESDSAKRAADEVARLAEELKNLRARANEAAMSANEKMVDLAVRVTEANKAILDYGRAHGGDLSKDPEFLKLQIARERLEIEYETARKESERAAKEQQDAAQRAAKRAQELADRAALQTFEAAEIPLKEQLRAIEKDRSLITQNNLIDSVTKQNRLNDNAASYRRVLEQIVALEKERLKVAKDPVEIARLKADIEARKGEAKNYGVSQKPATLEQQASQQYHGLGDPAQHFQTARSGMIAALQSQVARIGTLGDQINQKFQQVAQTISGSISSALTGVITRTENWHQALSNVASTILTAVIGAIIQMGVEWVAQQVMMAIVGRATAASVAAANVPIAMAQSAIWAAPATLATIATFGGAAAAAPLEIAGALVETEGLALASDGGVFDGDPSQPRGIFHGGEGILTARAMRIPGADTVVHALNAGDRLSALRGLQSSVTGGLARRANSVASAKAAASGQGISVAFVDDRQAVSREMRKSSGQKAVIEMVRNNRGQFFA